MGKANIPWLVMFPYFYEATNMNRGVAVVELAARLLHVTLPLTHYKILRLEEMHILV
jgi:hypothetical protein